MQKHPSHLMLEFDARVQIDPKTGNIWVCCANEAEIIRLGFITVLRITRLPREYFDSSGFVGEIGIDAGTLKVIEDKSNINCMYCMGRASSGDHEQST